MLVLLLATVVTASLRWALVGDDDWSGKEVCLMQQKLSQLDSTKVKHDVMFLGSSKTLRQIDPSLTDSILSVSSYNLGVQSYFPPRLWRLMEFLGSGDQEKAPELFVVEIAPLSMVGGNYNSSPTRQAITLQSLLVMFDYTFSLPISSKIRSKYWFNYIRLVLFKYSGLGFALEFEDKLKENKCDPDDVWLNIASRKGFFGADQELELTGSRDLLERKQTLYKEFKGDELSEFFSAASKPSKDYDLRYNERMLESVRRLENLGSKVVFVVPPRQGPNASLAVRAQERFLLNEGYSVFSFNDTQKYPELYSLENSFDKFHLNQKGAKVYTLLIAKAIAPLLED